MREEFLHYLWKYSLFDSKNLKTVSGEPVNILKTGLHNQDSGPDFFNAKLKIGDTIWAGNVEIHIKASDWEKHHHHQDAAYDNIILHLVHENDKPVFRKNGELIPVVDVSGLFDKGLYAKYKNFIESKGWIPCQRAIDGVDSFVVNNWIDRLVVERLERKTGSILQHLKLYRNDWAETFYVFLARNFGFKINSEPFELLAKSLPFQYLSRHRNNPVQVEALLFGQAGLLEDKFEEEYPKTLQKEYLFLRAKYGLEPIDRHLWKYLRLRPPNFPAIRIAQFADLMQGTQSLFSEIVENKKPDHIFKRLEVSASGFWERHYTFHKKSKKSSRQLGKTSINNILINTVAPVLFIYGKQKGLPEQQDKALKILEQVKGEDNAIVTKWGKLGLNTSSAYQTQALLELKNEYCSQKKCLNCGIGNQIMRSTKKGYQ